MATAAEPQQTALPPATRPSPEVRLHPRSFHRDDLFLLFGSLASSFCLVWLIYGFLHVGLDPLSGAAGFSAGWLGAFLVIYWLVVFEARGRLAAADGLMMVLTSAAGLAMIGVLVLIMVMVLRQGLPTITPHFLVGDVEVCGPLAGVACGGIGHAIVGTVEQVGLAVVMAVPLSLLCAVFLNEIGGPLERPVRIFVDAMSGVPSIVAGLFIYAVWVLALHKGFSGFAASLALSILMLPTVTRTSEVVLRLVPDGLREGALALGSTEWRMVWQVVLPTARSGLISAVILGVARAVGETAPLLLLVFGSTGFNWNPFSGGQEGLPLFIYTNVRFSYSYLPPYHWAWSAAVVLTVLVVGLFTVTRLVSGYFSVEARQRRASRRMARETRRGRAAGSAQP